MKKIFISALATCLVMAGVSCASWGRKEKGAAIGAGTGAVANWLARQDVIPTRFTIMGYGESQPIAANDSEKNRRLNRRVEIGIMANDKLKKAAKFKVEQYN